MMLVLYHLRLRNYHSTFKDPSPPEQGTAKESTLIFKVSLMVFPTFIKWTHDIFHSNSCIDSVKNVSFKILCHKRLNKPAQYQSLLSHKTHFICEKYCLVYFIKGIKHFHGTLSKVSRVCEPYFSEAPLKSLSPDVEY